MANRPERAGPDRVRVVGTITVKNLWFHNEIVKPREIPGGSQRMTTNRPWKSSKAGSSDWTM